MEIKFMCKPNTGIYIPGHGVIEVPDDGVVVATSEAMLKSLDRCATAKREDPPKPVPVSPPKVIIDPPAAIEEKPKKKPVMKIKPVIKKSTKK